MRALYHTAASHFNGVVELCKHAAKSGYIGVIRFSHDCSRNRRPGIESRIYFVANQLCLDFLNTRLSQRKEAFEFLTDVRAVSRWLAAAGLVSPAKAREAADRWSVREGGPAFMSGIWAFRDELRDAVLSFENEKKPKAAFIRNLNRLLAEHPICYELHMAGMQPKLRRRLDLCVPDNVYGPIADAAASLLARDPSRVRKCEACPGHFFDTSKKGARRWCSMRRCGNKVKVAAYTQRRAEGVTSTK